MKLPETFEEMTVCLNKSDTRNLKSILDGRIGFPSTSTNAILLHGANGMGKTIFAQMFPALYEYHLASAENRLAFDYNYSYGYEMVSITPQNNDKPTKTIDPEVCNCGNKKRQEILKMFEDQLSVHSYRALNNNYHYFVLDEVDLLKSYQADLKSLLNDTDDAIFIMTTNNINEVDPGLRDRAYEFKSYLHTPADVLPIIRRSYNFEHLTDEDILQIISSKGVTLRQIDRICESLSSEMAVC